MQVEVRQLRVDEVPGLGIELLAAGLVERSFGLFHQLIVFRVLPPRQDLSVLALGVQIAPKIVIRVVAIGVALDQPIKCALVSSLTE
jgi:hypothetical protein